MSGTFINNIICDKVSCDDIYIFSGMPTKKLSKKTINFYYDDKLEFKNWVKDFDEHNKDVRFKIFC